MPSSHYYQINEIVDLITLTNPGKLLDIGPGFGKYGFLAREYLELWNEESEYSKWKRQIDAIEAFQPYVTVLQKSIYDNIFIGNALDLIPSLKDCYDLILMIDVFEHFTRADGVKLLEECRKNGRNIIISVPKMMSDQEAAFGNEYEVHKYAWKKMDFRQIRDKFFLDNPKSLICFIGADSERIRKIIQKRRNRQAFISILDFLHMKNAVKKIFAKWI